MTKLKYVPKLIMDSIRTTKETVTSMNRIIKCFLYGLALSVVFVRTTYLLNVMLVDVLPAMLLTVTTIIRIESVSIVKGWMVM